MKLWIVVNHFLRNNKFIELENCFAKAAINNDIQYEIVTNAECLSGLTCNGISTGIIPDDGNPILFWDKDIMLARCLEKNGHRLYNPSNAIEICDNKLLMAVTLANSNITMPLTIPAPMTYSNVGYNDTSFLNQAMEVLDYPIIVKEGFGSFGAQVYIARNFEELVSICVDINYPFLLQEYIASSHGKDIRLQVVGDKVVAAMYRYSDNDFRANITNGGKMKAYHANDKQAELAVKCCKELGLDFAGVDILFGDNDEPVLCEVNSNAHFKNIDDCTGSDVADEIIKHIIMTYNS